ncbi:MAG: GntR family transcriptional regulator [Hyphomicrobiales bacterium]
MAGRRAQPFDVQLASDFVLDDYARSLSLGACIALHLRKHIINGELKPGDPLPEASVAKAFQTSRAPVRDAMRLLASEGLVITASQSGNYIAPISMDDVNTGSFIRSTLEERNIMELAGTITPTQLKRLGEIVAAQAAAIADGAFASFHQLDEEFHHSLFDCAGRASVWDFLQSVKVHIDRARTLTLSKGQTAHQALADHEMIVKALQDGDPAAARLAMQQHLDRIHSLVRSVTADLADCDQVIAQ